MTSDDLKFLSEKTNLSESRLLILLEDDASLLIENLPDSQTEGIITISFPLFVKCTVLKETKDKPFGLYEKEYVAESIIEFPQLSKSVTPYITDKPNIGETEAKYYLIMLGMFPQVIARINRKGGPDVNFYGGIAQQGFRSANRDELAEHTFEWIATLRDIRNLIWH